MELTSYKKFFEANGVNRKIDVHAYNYLVNDDDLVIIWFLLTPTGKVSTHWFVLRFSPLYENTKEYIEKEIDSAKSEIPKKYNKYIKKGYTVSNPYLYSGKF